MLLHLIKSLLLIFFILSLLAIFTKPIDKKIISNYLKKMSIYISFILDIFIFHKTIRNMFFYIITVTYLANSTNFFEGIIYTFILSIIISSITPTYSFCSKKHKSKEILQFMITKTEIWSIIFSVLSLVTSITSFATGYLKPIIKFLNNFNWPQNSLDNSMWIFIAITFFLFGLVFDLTTYLWSNFYLNVINQIYFTNKLNEEN